jgi:hypothetical protein
MAGTLQNEWPFDEADIKGLDSDWLHEHRPNRWKGAPSTWNGYTESERFGSESLNLVRNQDLSIHLYNAFILKRDGLSMSPWPDFRQTIASVL